MQSHVITLSVESGHVTCNPDPSHQTFAVGDTLSFVSRDGNPNVTFDQPHPFSAGEFKAGDQPLKVVRKGRFSFHCGLQLPDGQIIGWPQDPNSGGGGET